ncbi:MAG: hypothetical protein FWB90_01655 [Fibromonadales bacterium]|nr:hypothetical protein [Fibromonadales bacterium]
MRCAIAISLLALLSLSCGKHGHETSYDSLAEVIFYNESNYHISIYHTSFSGSLIVDKLAPGQIYSTELYPSNNYGIGSVFSVRYWYLIEGENFWTGGIDPDAQITQNIEAGQRYIIQIPSPKKLEGSEAFFKVLNASGMPIEFRRYGTVFVQINGEHSVPSGKTGIYKINSGEISEYTIFQQIDNYYPIPEFTAKNGYIYIFEFNGTEVIPAGEQKI